MRITRIAVTGILACALTVVGLASPANAALPRPAHIVILIDENHAFSQINGPATYLTSLAKGGALFTQSFAIRHPSEPNYLALFSGSTQSVTNDSCPHTFTGANLASRLNAASLTFAGYSESMPSDGYTGCTSGPYARKHNPWVNFSNVPSSQNLRFSRFPTDFTTLPTVSIVVPNLNDDMHDGSVSTGDTWAKNHIDAYAQWAKTHNSLLIVTFDGTAARTATRSSPSSMDSRSGPAATPSTSRTTPSCAPWRTCTAWPATSAALPTPGSDHPSWRPDGPCTAPAPL